MDRFQKIYSQGVVNIIEIWVDRETGVNYVFRKDGYAGAGASSEHAVLQSTVNHYKVKGG